MKSIKTLTLLMASTLVLGSCQAKVDPNGVKTKLADLKYSVSLYAASDAPKELPLEGFEHYLTATKVSNADGAIMLNAYFFVDIETANKMWDAAASKLVSETLKTGVHNNVVFVGHEQAVKDAGFSAF